MKLPPLPASLTKTGGEQSEFCRASPSRYESHKTPRGRRFTWDKNPATNGMLQDVFAIAKEGITAQIGFRELRHGQQFRIYSGTCWLGEPLLQHFNDTWAEYFAFLCTKPHSAGMRLCPLRYIIYIKISPASQHDFHVPPPFR